MHMDNDVTLQHTPGSIQRSPHTAGSITRSTHYPGSIKGSPNQRRVPLVRVGKVEKCGDVL